jgi:hypothetical protein
VSWLVDCARDLLDGLYHLGGWAGILTYALVLLTALAAGLGAFMWPVKGEPDERD